jgi:uncharacterized membrane protein
VLLFVNTKKSYDWILPVPIVFFYTWNTINNPRVRFASAKSFSRKSVTKSEVLLLIDAFFLRCYCLEFSLFRDFFSLSNIYTREKFVSNIEVASVKFIWLILHFWRLYWRFKSNDGSNARARSILHCLLKLSMPQEKALCDFKFSECYW